MYALLHNIFSPRFLLWTLAAAFLIAGGTCQEKNPKAIVGIADSQSKIITLDREARIKRIYTSTGQNVESTELLMELEDSQLNIQLEKINREILGLKAEYDLNQRLKRATGVLNKQLRDPVLLKLTSLKEERKILQTQLSSLQIRASIAGTVAAIHYKEGDLVAPFQPIIEVYEGLPQFVRGYLHESLPKPEGNAGNLTVSSVSNSELSYYGKVVSVGNRMVPFPDRLKRSPTQVLWGREIIIELPPENSLTLGEKVRIENLPGINGSGNTLWKTLQSFFFESEKKNEINELSSTITPQH